LITACVNFINMATAQAVNRSKEIGVRKVLGGRRNELFWQFISETSVITVLSILFAIGLSFLAMPYVNNWFHSHIKLQLFTDGQLLLFIFGLAIVVTFLAGSYPGLILSGFKPIQALRNKIAQNQAGGLNTRRGLIITQFAISQILTIAVIIIAMQMNYAKDSDLGFKKNSIVLLPVESTPQNAKTLKNELMQISGVNNVSLCAAAPASYNTWNTSPRFDNRLEDEPFRTSLKAGDENYVKTFGLKIVAGRNLFASDSAKQFLVNETFVRKLNLTSPEQVLGKSLSVNGNITGTIVGVIKDFHDQSFYKDINAISIASEPDRYYTYAVDINLDKVPATMAAVEKVWNKMNPSEIFSYEFLDEHIATFYKSEELMLKLIKVFSVFAIFIGCLGLYGLVFFMAAQKTKEIGIRKVLGGSYTHILWIFGREFSKLIILAFCIAAPVGYWLMNKWLQDFQFRIPISIWIFITVIAVTFFICFLTVSYQAIKATMVNPVKSLRAE
ncbi:MAG: FtsX-like permease family protein, partial [Ferruginibacter sp.]